MRSWCGSILWLINFAGTRFNVLYCAGEMSHSFVVSSPSKAYKSLTATIKEIIKETKETITCEG